MVHYRRDATGRQDGEVAEILVREARPEDADEIARVHVGTWQAAYREMVPDDYLDGLDVDARVSAYERFGILSDPSRPMWVAEMGGAIVGFVNVGPSRDEPELGELYAIYVSRDSWSKGVGRSLIEVGVEWLRARYAQATLWVLAENERTRRFYERAGWYFDGATKEDDLRGFVLKEVRYRIDL